ncbi:anaerobic ribonucleoside-triphosphate reductase [Chromatium okenii]|uniref:anaerobic ribonucleoside-triphosphate reductase n=1 Tax=Chromatium okenii TaxID=61644 RepID=UPI0034E98119
MSELTTEERTECEVWTRVMGYHRPMAWFNAGKKAEFADRKYFMESNCCGQIRKVDQLLRNTKESVSPPICVPQASGPSAGAAPSALKKAWSLASTKPNCGLLQTLSVASQASAHS